MPKIRCQLTWWWVAGRRGKVASIAFGPVSKRLATTANAFAKFVIALTKRKGKSSHVGRKLQTEFTHHSLI